MADFYFQVTDTAQQRTNLLNFLLSTVANTQGVKGDEGKSAYQVALSIGFVGSESEWIASLKGDKGDIGQSYVPDAFGHISDRTMYDNQLAGFGFLDIDNSLLFIKKSNSTGDWFNGLPFGKGDKGDKGDTGDSITSVTSSKVGKTTTVNVYIEDLLANSFYVNDGADGTGVGDMVKSVYDSNNNGKVDVSESVHFNTSNLVSPTTIGQMSWSVDDGTFEVYLGNGVTLQGGLENLIPVKNNTSSVITNMTVCMATGSVGASGKITVAPMDGTVQSNADKIVGMATQDIAVGAIGFLTTQGTVRGINTSTLTEGSPVYVSTTVLGGVTTTPPLTGMKLKVGYVIYSHATVGSMLFRTTILDENLYITKTSNDTKDGVLTFSNPPIVDGKQVSTGQRKNYLINGNFDKWDYATSQTTSGHGSDNRWNNSNAGSTKTHSRVACIDTERALFNASYFSRTVVNSIAGSANFVYKVQHIENVSMLAGKTVTLSFWAKADSNKNIAIEMGQVFGLGGTPSNYVSSIGSQLVPLTTTWQKKTITISLPSIVGKTLGTDGPHTSTTYLAFWFDAGSSNDQRTANLGQQSGTFDIAQIRIEDGSIATDGWHPYDGEFGGEVQACERYLPIEFVGKRVSGQVYQTISAVFPVVFREQVRVPPTGVTILGSAILIKADGSTSTITSIALNGISISGAMLDCTSSGLVPGNASTFIIISGVLLFTGCEL